MGVRSSLLDQVGRGALTISDTAFRNQMATGEWFEDLDTCAQVRVMVAMELSRKLAWVVEKVVQSISRLVEYRMAGGWTAQEQSRRFNKSVKCSPSWHRERSFKAMTDVILE